MEYRKFGNTGMVVSKLALGCPPGSARLSARGPTTLLAASEGANNAVQASPRAGSDGEGPGKGGQGATIFHAKAFAKALPLYSHH